MFGESRFATIITKDGSLIGVTSEKEIKAFQEAAAKRGEHVIVIRH